MRYRLRTLLILLAIGPPVLAVTWMVGRGGSVHPVLLVAVIYMSLVVMLLVASWATEAGAFSPIARRSGLRDRPVAHCSFCRQSHREVGPLAEGPDAVYICRACVQACGNLIDEERNRLGQVKP